MHGLPNLKILPVLPLRPVQNLHYFCSDKLYIKSKNNVVTRKHTSAGPII